MRPVLAMLALVAATGSVTAQDAPQFRPDPFWPKPLPHNWILGQVAGLATDRNDHVWIVHRPRTLLDDEKGAMQNPPATKCCTAAPPVMEFDADGNLLRSWGGSGQGYEWPKSEHGIFVDKEGNVWIAGNDKSDHQILKFAFKWVHNIGIDSKGQSLHCGGRIWTPSPEVRPDRSSGAIAARLR